MQMFVLPVMPPKVWVRLLAAGDALAEACGVAVPLKFDPRISSSVPGFRVVFCLTWALPIWVNPRARPS